MSKEKLKKFIEKLKTNTEYKACSSKHFILYDKDTAEKITEHGKKILNKTEKIYLKYFDKNFDNSK
jgi:hypothetical protein